MKFTYRQLGHFGALGNQLWEIASTAAIAEKCMSDSVFPSWGYAPYFNMPEYMFVDDPPLEIDLSGNYLQDANIINPIFADIKRWFSPSKMSEDRIALEFPNDLCEYTAVHVRRANNLNLPNHHPVQPVEYFQQALDILKPNKVIVFSDDLDWCRQQSCFEGAVFGMGNNSSIDIYELTGANPLTLATVALDLLAMAKCGQHIISNSTFSWWAAYLADRYKVIYPLNWYGPEVHADYTLMMKGLEWTGI